jgi:hypothetical protein
MKSTSSSWPPNTISGHIAGHSIRRIAKVRLYCTPRAARAFRPALPWQDQLSYGTIPVSDPTAAIQKRTKAPRVTRGTCPVRQCVGVGTSLDAAHGVGAEGGLVASSPSTKAKAVVADDDDDQKEKGCRNRCSNRSTRSARKPPRDVALSPWHLEEGIRHAL